MSSLSYRFSLRGRFAMLASLVLLTAIVGASAAQAYEQPKFNNVSGDPDESLKPRVAQGPDGNVHVVWDSSESSRKVMYSKGTWNGSNYTFSPKQVVGDAGRWQYATPNVFVAPNNQVAVVWSEPTLKVKVFAADAGPPAGPGTAIGNGITPSLSADYNNNFHITWNGDFKVQYCEFANDTCVARETLDGGEGSLRPEVVVDDENNVHLLWEGGQQVKYRTRVAGGGALGPTETIGGGTFAQIAVDGKGGIHIVSSRDYNAVYCRKTLNGPCVESKTFDYASDLEPSIGATRGGNVMVIFRDDDNDLLAINVFENGTWSASDDIAGSTTQVDITSRPYTNRFSFVWGADYDIQHGHVAVVPTDCDSVVAGLPEPAVAPAQAAPVAPAQLPAQLPSRLYLPVFEVAPPTPPRGAC